MNDIIQQLLEKKNSCYAAIGKSVNLFLYVEKAALGGNEELRASLEYIKKNVPESYKYSEDSDAFHGFYIGQNFIILMAEFESFLVNIMRLILKKYPQKMTETFKLSEILELHDMDSVIGLACERYLNSIMYKKANDYRHSLVEILSADKEFLANLWPQYVECKARRDIGIHNDWLINETYKRKLNEVGIKKSSSGYFPPSNKYFWDSLRLLSMLTDEIAIHTQKKFAE